jgi:hypothetical protein
MSDDQTDRSGSIYSFGETNLAAERLRVVSEVFDPTSEAFVSETVRNRPGLALDLGMRPRFHHAASKVLRNNTRGPSHYRTIKLG